MGDSLATLGTTITKALPGNLLALLLLNVLVVGGMMYVEDRRSEARGVMISRIIEYCLHVTPSAPGRPPL
jgi:hypothetical protein